MSEVPTAGVVGWPAGHSRSPRLFAHWFGVHGIAGHYLPLPVAAADLETVLRALPKAGLRGVNVTLPHKEAALALADEATGTARAIGAANTLSFQGGLIHADNTDVTGFLENLRAGAPGWRADAGPALVLGAGGASRALIFGLLAEGAPAVRLANRTRARAEELGAVFGPRVEVVDWQERSAALAGATTVVNATALGMAGQGALEIDLGAAPGEAVVTDIVYAPLETALLAAAKARGLRTVDGLGMLLHQAVPGFERWFGVRPQVDAALRAACLGA